MWIIFRRQFDHSIIDWFLFIFFLGFCQKNSKHSTIVKRYSIEKHLRLSLHWTFSLPYSRRLLRKIYCLHLFILQQIYRCILVLWIFSVCQRDIFNVLCWYRWLFFVNALYFGLKIALFISSLWVFYFSHI